MYDATTGGWNWTQPQYQPHAFANMPMLQHYEIIKVNGEAGAKNFRMAPNSSILLLDETASIVWFAQTDGAGYLTVTPFDVTPHKSQPQIDLNNLSDRITKLEEEFANVQQSYSGAPRQSKKQQRQPSEPSAAATT